MKSFILTASLLSSTLLPAQTADTPIYEQRGTANKQTNQQIIKKALRVREQVSAISKVEIDRQSIDPVPEPIQLPPALSQAMSPADIADHARKTNLRVGYCYKCNSCDEWHISLAGGYAIAANTIVTCDHVLATKTKMRDGFLVAVDHKGNVATAETRDFWRPRETHGGNGTEEHWNANGESYWLIGEAMAGEMLTLLDVGNGVTNPPIKNPIAPTTPSP